MEWIGWFSSAVLLLTICSQIVRQWQSGTSEGVSPWLFVGQATASSGFVVYSVAIANAVFVAINALMLVSASIGLVIWLRHRRAGKAG